MQFAVAQRQTIAYPIRLRVRYQAGLAIRGEGSTVTLSSKTVVFAGGGDLPIGTVVRLCIDWPVRLEKKIDLTLNVHGKTIQPEGPHTAVEIVRHEFRIRPRGDYKLLPPCSQPDDEV